MPKGPNRVCLDFRHSSRFQHEVCDELGERILSISRITPNGMVVFLPSYSYEAFVVKRWKATGAYEKIKEEKKMFREPQSARDVEAIIHLHRIPIKPLPRMELSCYV
jgi:chromosome transmission fidelity protein 1